MKRGPEDRTGDYLPEALRSAVEQAYPRLEIIVSDDGYTDPTPEEVAAFG